MGQFRRSGTFGIVGVVVVMVLVAVVGLTMGQGQAKPKGALALIFGIVAVYLLILFFLQNRDLTAAQTADTHGRAAPPGSLENPVALDEPALFVAMAVRPIDSDAMRARQAGWGVARGSMRMAMLVTALIFLSVPPIYLFDTFVPLMIGGPLIAGIALWKSVMLLGRGGHLDEAYDQASRAMAPLGLSVTERPELTLEPKSIQPFRMGPAMHGAMVMRGNRHGRAVEVRMPSEGVRATSEVKVGTALPEFEFRARDGGLRADDRAPAFATEVLRAIPSSTRWNGVTGRAGPDGVVVERKGSQDGDWLLDLWLAERLSSAGR